MAFALRVAELLLFPSTYGEQDEAKNEDKKRSNSFLIIF
jgi:hypothetical protein